MISLLFTEVTPMRYKEYAFYINPGAKRKKTSNKGDLSGGILEYVLQNGYFKNDFYI